MSNTASRRALHGLCTALVLALASAQAADLYVSTQGSDSNPGTSAQPYRSITYAYSKAAAGTTVHVMPGVYNDYTSGWGIHLGRSGTASNPIILRSEQRGGAIIDGVNASDRNQGFYIDGSYNTVDGFEIRNCPNGGIAIWASNNRIINNHIHNNGNPASSSTNGKDGVYSNQGTSGNYYGANYVHDNGRPGSNLDHGLYICGQNETVVNNVLVHNAATGLQLAGYTTIRNTIVYNNVMALNGTAGIILWQSLNAVDIKNNIVYKNGHYGVGSYDAHGSGVAVDHNLCYGNGSGSYDFTSGGSDYSYSLGTSLSADPLFADSAAATFDAHLRAGSPGLQAGLNLYSALSADLLGVARSATGAWDLGVYAGSASANTAPTISGIAARTILTGGSTGPLPFTVGDAQLSVANLVVSAKSSNPSLVPDASIVLAGSGASRTVSVTPLNGPVGGATITLTVSDGSLSASTSFSLTVNPVPAPILTLTSPANGTAYAASATINLAASVTANGHTNLQVQFFNGSKLLGTDTTAPLSYTWGNVGAGSYSLSARLLYDAGSTLVSSSSSVTVTSAPASQSSLTVASTSGAITAPFAAANGTVSQPSYTGVTAGGQAIYAFQVPAAGDYLVTALVNAPSLDNNSLFVNIDAQPTDPTMTWDIPVTAGLSSQVVSWRGNGGSSSTSPSGLSAQFAPKVFTLAVGAHQLVIRGREGNCQLGTITLQAVGAPVVTLSSPTISPPFYKTNNAIVQPIFTSIAGSGQAVYTFNLSSAGNYSVSAVVNAPTTDNNSCLVNIDGQPSDPAMVWDIPVTSGFATQPLSWRGNGTASSSSASGLTAQFAPKIFQLSAGAHQLIVRGREGNCQIGAITIVPSPLSAN